MKSIVRVVVKVTTEEGRHCLNEIKELKEGAELVGTYTEENNAFDFTWNNEAAVLWVGENCEIAATLEIEYAIARKNSIKAAELAEDFFAEESDARRFKDENGGYLYFGASWHNIKTDDYETPPFWAKTEKGAIDKLNRYYNE